MKNLETGTRVVVTDKTRKKVIIWYGTIKVIHGNVNPPDGSDDGVGYSIKPEGEQFTIFKVRHHTFVRKA